MTNPNLPTSTLRSVIAALDRLNSWVRSREGQTFKPRRAVYWWKRRALEQADAAGLIDDVRFVSTLVSCRTCGGTGVYDDGWSEPGWEEDCRRCGGFGSFRLYFVETRLDGVRWHTPHGNWPLYRRYPSPRVEDFEEIEGWHPNAEGRALEPWEVAGALNLVEPAFLPEPLPKYFTGESAYGHFSFPLYLGETDARRCAFCHAAADGSRSVVVRSRAEWLDHACRRCEERFDRLGGGLFARFPFPVYLAGHPEIRAWLERNAPELAALDGSETTAEFEEHCL